MSLEYDVSPKSPYQEKYLTNSSRLLLSGGAMGCVDGDTEYLGEHGWKFIRDYDGEKVYNYCPEKDSVELEIPEYVNDIGETLYRLHNEHTDMVLSMLHRTLYYREIGSNPVITDTNTLIENYNKNEDTVGFVKYYDGANIGYAPFAGYKIEEFIPEDGRQYCFRTTTGYFVARRNGKYFITGNSSKTYIGLMRHLRWTDNPNYVGLIVRKNMTAIKAAGGVFDESLGLFRKVYPDLTYTLQPRRIRFPSGALIEYHHYENDKAGDSFQGLNIDTCFFDEVNHASEEHIYWLNSRIRNVKSGIKDKSLWMSCNPSNNSWLLTSGYLDYYIHPEGHPKAGLPNAERNGKETYLARVGGKAYFAETREELINRFGKSIEPITFTVLLGTVYDNPILLEKSPEYLANLKAMSEVEMKRNLLGDWFARVEGSSYFDRDWVEELVDDVDPNEVLNTVRAYDFAGTVPSDANPYPDYTACVKMSKMKNGDYVIRDIKRTRIRFGDWEDFIVSNALEDSMELPKTTICLPISPNPESKAATMMMARKLGGQGFVVKVLQATGNSSKMDGFRPFAALAQNGGVKILTGCMFDIDTDVVDNDIYYKELESFDGTRSTRTRKDDLVDCTSSSFSLLASAKTLPNISAGLASNLTMLDNNPLHRM